VNPWDLIAMQPVINVLIVLSHYLFNNFGLAIIALTIVVNVCLLPLTLRQMRASKAMQELQPKLAELQKKYARDRQKLAQEQMQLYRETGMSPLGCLGPMLIQIPIWVALYQSIIRLLAVTPEDFLGLARYLYSWPLVYSTLPLGSKFLWLNLAVPDPTFVLAILVGLTMYFQQKMVTPPVTNPDQQRQSRLMLWMMPMMFAYITLLLPSGLALFWVTSSIVRIVAQYFTSGGGLGSARVPSRVSRRDKKYRKHIDESASRSDIASADIVVSSSAQGEESDYGESGGKRQDRGGGYPTGLKSIRRQSGRGKSHRSK
jgi:YidC/Oxa1 family membrane protein insertase